jgi:hypothetical protein
MTHVKFQIKNNIFLIYELKRKKERIELMIYNDKKRGVLQKIKKFIKLYIIFYKMKNKINQNI